MTLFRQKASPKPRFESVVESDLPVLYRLAQALTGNQTDAEDLVAQTLYLSAKAWHAFDGRHPRSWMIKIMRNEHLSSVRKKSASATVALDDVAEPSAEGFWEAIDWRAIGESVIAELAQIPEEYGFAVALCDIEEMSYEEAAEAMNCPAGTVRSRLYRGRNMLRARLVRRLGETTDFA
ncbi:MAG: sigma-70 family RNA polymerase sigma factor [Chthonomonas sp.]|nr:sigma-70 family RNA polymerase sigma factor [Chthonomonas sp.]